MLHCRYLGYRRLRQQELLSLTSCTRSFGSGRMPLVTTPQHQQQEEVTIVLAAAYAIVTIQLQTVPMVCAPAVVQTVFTIVRAYVTEVSRVTTTAMKTPQRKYLSGLGALTVSATSLRMTATTACVHPVVPVDTATEAVSVTGASRRMRLRKCLRKKKRRRSDLNAALVVANTPRIIVSIICAATAARA